MKKNWFIVKAEEHLGPYSHLDLKDFFGQKSITKETKVWRKGLPKAIYYHEIQLYLHDDPPKNKYKTREQEAVKRLEGGLHVLQHQEPFKLSNGTTAFPLGKLVFGLCFLLCLAVLPLGYEFYKISNSKFSRPNGMKNSDYERLVEVSRNAFNESKVAFAVSKDMSEIWMATNFAFNGKVLLEMESNHDKMLHPEIIKIYGEGYLNNRLVTFPKLNYLVGTRLLPGYYKLKVSFISPIEKSFFLEKFHPLNHKLSSVSEELISVAEKHVYDAKLNELNDKRKVAGKRAWIELQQKFHTLSTVSSQIKDELLQVYNEHMSNTEWQEKLAGFQQKYESYFGTFFTNFVSKDFRDIAGAEEILSEDVRKLSSYHEALVGLTGDAAGYSVRSMGDMQRYSRAPSATEWIQLEEKILARYAKITEKVEKSLLELEPFLAN
ncbi:MAG: DUF4339 domain-containing protein [Bacteriovoracaceae bacterium]|nr:DUF4339 domain-containing protein [Bacteriovoracaceae bacterium]